jgi:hypothetical protein
MFRPCPEGMANSGPNMVIVEFFFPNPFFSPIPVVPHKAVAEVSKIGNL